MSVDSEIQQLETNITNTYTTISNKGGTIPAHKNANNLATSISSIPYTQAPYVDRLIRVNDSSTLKNLTQTGVSFILNPNVTTLGKAALYYAFYNGKIISADFNNLTSINGDYACYYIFAGSSTSLTTVDMSGVTSISGVSAFQSAFYNCMELDTFTTSNSLTFSSVSDSCFYNTFNGCSKLTTAPFFNKMTVVDGSNACRQMFMYAGITSLDVSGLTQVTGNNAMRETFKNCSNINSALTFTNLTTLGYESFEYTFSYCSKLTSVSFPALTTLNTHSLYSTFERCSRITSASFGALVQVVSGYSDVLYRTFEYCTGLTTVNFPALTTVSAYRGFDLTFNNCSGLTTVSFPQLQTVSGTQAFSQTFGGCTSLTEISFPEISTINGSKAMSYLFYGCTALKKVYFGKHSSTIAFGSYTNQFNNMLSGCTGVTVHFPAACQSTMSSWSDVTAGFGGTNTTVLFDL